MTINKNAIPNDPEKPMVTSGVRIGTPALTTRGFKEEEARATAHLIADVLDKPRDPNNIAAVLARWDSGSLERFVARMNATARSLGMADTRYTDPSGYDDATVSTAADQVRIVDRAMRLSVFARIVALPSAWLPVAGVVHNTDTLLGRGGFVGVKTGSDTAAGGCFAFRAVRWVGGKRTTITGVVLGQPGHDRIAAALGAAAAMVDRITGQRPLPGLLQRPPREKP